MSLDDEGCIGIGCFEATCRIDRVNDRQAQPAARLKNACDFSDSGGHRVNVVKRHKSNREISACVVERKCGSVGQTEIHRRIEFASGINK
jgi:hypothetical protein